jgi:hypothetical protein
MGPCIFNKWSAKIEFYRDFSKKIFIRYLVYSFFGTQMPQIRGIFADKFVHRFHRLTQIAVHPNRV